MEIKEYRFGVVGVFYDKNSNKVLVCERSNQQGVWQFPQGGIDFPESPEQTVYREMQEELGTKAVEVLYRGNGLTTYDFPVEAKFKIAKRFRGQKHYWFLLGFIDDAGPDLANSDGEFRAYKWVSVDEALREVVDWKRDAYESGLRLLNMMMD